MSFGAGDRFQKDTKYVRNSMPGGYLDWSHKPGTYKNYSDCKVVTLPTPNIEQETQFDVVLKKRRSIREFSKAPISKLQLSYLLWTSTGIQRRDGEFEFRTVPSAGALYPIETYLVANNVEDLEEGIFHYSVKSHLLEQLKENSFGRLVAKAALEQTMLSKAAVVFVWTALFARSKWKYGQRAYRYIYIDAGHIAQNLALSASRLGLGSCQVAAFYDDEVNEIIGVDGIAESAIYLSVIGHPK
jgi:SagB-type dehydrogenase family enzyme